MKKLRSYQKVEASEATDQRVVKLAKIPKNLQHALQLAETSDYPNYRLGAIISTRKNSPPVSMGVNRFKATPLQLKFSANTVDDDHLSTHAEIDAISRCRVSDLQGSHIFVARVTRTGKWGNSRPCSGCMRALRHFGVRYVYYYQSGIFYREQIG